MGRTDNSISRMRLRMWEAHVSFLFFKEIHAALQENRDTYERHEEFFGTTMRSLHKSYVLDLWTFFDKTNRSLSYKVLLEELKNNSPHDHYCKVKEQTEDLLSDSTTVDLVKAVRGEIAHLTKEGEKEYDIAFRDIEELFTITQKVFSLLEGESAHTMFETITKEVPKEVEVLFKELSLGRESHIEQITSARKEQRKGV